MMKIASWYPSVDEITEKKNKMSDQEDMHSLNCDCDLCFFERNPVSPIVESPPWPESLDPRDKERAKFFTIAPDVLENVMEWLYTKVEMLNLPSLIATREIHGQSLYLYALREFFDDNILQLFREFANDMDVEKGLLFRSFPVTISGARQLLRSDQDVFECIKTEKHYFDFYYCDQLPLPSFHEN